MSRLDEIRAKRCTTRFCEHSHTAWSCPRCDDAETIAELQDRIDAAAKVLDAYGIPPLKCQRGECQHADCRALRILKGE